MAVIWSFPAGPLSYADGPTASTAALVDITPLGGGAPPQIPPIWTVGMRMRVTASGWCTSGSATPTLTFGLYLAAPATAIGSAVVLSTSAATALPASVTQGPWNLFWEGEVRGLSTPASATAANIQGRGYVDPVSTLSAFGTRSAMPTTYAARSVAFDSTKQQNLLIGATLSAITGTPSVACERLTVELLG